MDKENKESGFIQRIQLGFESNIANIAGAGASLNLLGYSLFEAPRYGVDKLVILKVATGVILGIVVFINSVVEGKERLDNSKHEIRNSNRT